VNRLSDQFVTTAVTQPFFGKRVHHQPKKKKKKKKALDNQGTDHPIADIHQ
jgi:hypothetical protein